MMSLGSMKASTHIEGILPNNICLFNEKYVYKVVKYALKRNLMRFKGRN